MSSSFLTVRWSHILCWYVTFAYIWCWSCVSCSMALRVRSRAFLLSWPVDGIPPSWKDHPDAQFNSIGALLYQPFHNLKVITSSISRPIWHLVIKKSDPYPPSKFIDTAPPSFLSSLHHLLASYENIFSTPKDLPLSWSFDYRIPLHPNTSPVTIKPYLY